MQALSPRERENLIIQHQVTALSTLKKHAPRGLPVEDLRQEALVALVLAVDTYDPAKGELTTHIYWVVRGAITNMAERERTQSQPYAGRFDDRMLRNHMVRLDEHLPGDGGTRLELLETTEPSPEEVAAHRELMATAELMLRVSKKEQVRARTRLKMQKKRATVSLPTRRHR